MHSPGAVLSPGVSTGAVAIVDLAAGLRGLPGRLGERAVPLMGRMAASGCAAWMVGFPLDRSVRDLPIERPGAEGRGVAARPDEAGFTVAGGRGSGQRVGHRVPFEAPL